MKGLNKGGVKRPDQARLALGMAYFQLGGLRRGSHAHSGQPARKVHAAKSGKRSQETGSAVDRLRDQRRRSSA